MLFSFFNKIQTPFCAFYVQRILCHDSKNLFTRKGYDFSNCLDNRLSSSWWIIHSIKLTVILQKIEFAGQEMLRHTPCNRRKMLDDSNSKCMIKQTLHIFLLA